MRQGSRRLTTIVAGVCVIGAIAVTSRGDAAAEVHLTAAGDYGVQPATVTVLDEVARRAPDAHLALGDLSYGNVATESDWCDFVKGRVGEGFPFQLISGNHESDDVPDGAINNFGACLPNQIPGVIGVYGREYVMDFPKNAPLVRVIQTSPNLTFEGARWEYRRGDAHYEWLSAAIDDGRDLGARWIIVTSHYPCLTVGANGCPGSASDFYDLLVTKRVDLVLHGHDHNYARTHQLRSGVPGCARVPAFTFDPDCVVDRDGDFVAGGGTVFATVGTGGIPLRPVDSADPEAGYFAAWSGSNSRPSNGLLDIRATDARLTASFVSTSGAGFTDSFTLTAGPVPPAPTTSSATSTSASPTTSTAPTSTTSTPSTTSTSSTTTTTTTTTTVPTTDVRDRDTFGRIVATGWGISDSGGLWSTSPSSSFSVDGSAGRFVTSAGTSRLALLTASAAVDNDLQVTVSNDKPPTGSGLYLSVIARAVPGASDYRTVVRTRSDGRVSLRLDRGTSPTIASEVTVPGLRVEPGQQLRVRVQAIGTAPTTVRAKIWPIGSAEPTAWLVETTDGTPALQAPGTVGLYAYLSSSATNGPITSTIDDLVVTTPRG